MLLQQEQVHVMALQIMEVISKHKTHILIMLDISNLIAVHVLTIIMAYMQKFLRAAVLQLILKEMLSTQELLHTFQILISKQML
jgi:hypothetical protein